MLIEFKFKNFLSFKDETSFLMTKVKSFKEHLKTNVIATGREFDLLKSAAIYGSNGSGKSNFIQAAVVMNGIISNSFSDSLKKDEEKPNNDFGYRLNSSSEKNNTMFEVSFLQEGIIYRYGFEIYKYEIKKEWLYRKLDREIALFTRDGQNFIVNKESFGEGEKYKDEVNSNVLFLSHLAQYNQKVSKKIIFWFYNFNVISGLHELFHKDFTTKLLRSDLNFQKWAANVLKYLEISNIEAGEKDGEIITYHNKYDENGLLIEAIPFQSKMESAGTVKLIHILGPIYDTLRRGGILFIDELDSKLHPNLTKKLMCFFQEFNFLKAQFIFSGQDTNLLDKKILRRDQIWFVEKDQFGASSLYSLAEFKSSAVRNSSAYDKKYLENTFGAAETLDINSKLTDLLYAS
ncbi:ATP-binding protein [uncultured Mucilaginibacter sp.]|uniref:AAA family ATPase n=1 Tax=uncultured Mucilaginibacter sp. TaxID=797541 RepID=UPI0025E30563|nr:ATP-binding protein [uncultured Mucilaginibacter sp.]